MHGRRRTGVERRKRGHGWYQSSVCITSFSFLILPTPQSGTGFLNLLLSAQIVSRILDTSLSEPLIHRCYIWRAGQLASLPLLFHPSSSFTPGLCPDTSSGELKVTHGHSETHCVPGPLTITSWSLWFYPPLQLPEVPGLWVQTFPFESYCFSPVWHYNLQLQELQVNLLYFNSPV